MVYLCETKKKDKEQSFLMIKTDEKPFTRFTYNSGKMVCMSDEVLNEILINSVNVSSFIKNLEKK